MEAIDTYIMVLLYDPFLKPSLNPSSYPLLNPIWSITSACSDEDVAPSLNAVYNDNR